MLTRGNTLKRKVLLLGGPNTYLPFLQECWRQRIPETWDERGYDYPKDVPIEELDLRPGERAVLRRATAPCCTACTRRRTSAGYTRHSTRLDEFITNGRKARLGETRGPAARRRTSERARRRSVELYTIPQFDAAEASSPARPSAASSASTAARPRRRPCSSTRTASILSKAYQLSKGNPIQDTKELLAQAARRSSTDQGATLEVIGFGATGYAADVLEESRAAPT